MTSNGTFCVDDLPIPSDIEDGTLATLQVILSDKGSALYNCADVRFTANATGPSSCSSNDIEIFKVMDQSAMDHDDEEGGDSEGSGEEEGGEEEGEGEGDGEDAAGILSLNKFTLTAVVGLGFSAMMLGL